jgi:rhodanese-related sulfurtransferase
LCSRVRCKLDFEEDGVPQTVDRQELHELMAAGAQIVKVLPREEYEEQHLPGAIHLPLRRIEKEARDVLDASRPVVVYCWDSA